MPNQQTQREFWSGKAGEEWAAHVKSTDAMLAPTAEAALAAGAIQAGERVLDIGCGAGGTSLDIARSVGASGGVVGVDVSPQLLSVARARAAEASLTIEFVEADAATACFDKPFDAAFSRFGVMFFDEPAPAFANIRQQVKSGGRLAFICWRTIEENAWSTAALAAIQPMLKTPLARPDPDAPGPFAFADATKVERILRDAGWRDVTLASWDGQVALGGGGTLDEAVEFAMKVGPCARLIAELDLDMAEARRRVAEQFRTQRQPNDFMFPAACWVVTARA